MKKFSSSHQKGIATLLIILTISIAILVSTIGVIANLKSVQQRQISIHSSLGAQALAWQGVKIVDSYLQGVNNDILLNWSNNAEPITLSIGDNSRYKAVLTHIQNTGTNIDSHGKTLYNYLITAQITGIAFSGKNTSQSTLETTYSISSYENTTSTEETSPGSTTSVINVFNIKHDLNMTGGIKVIGGKTANFNVEGDANLDSASIDGINAINATGNVHVGSGIKVNSIYSNGDVSLTGSASVNQIKSLGDVTISGGTSSMSIQSNKSVTFTGGQASSVDSIGDVIVSAGGVNITSINSEGNLNWTGSGGGVSNASVNGFITYAGNNKNPTNLSSGSDITITGGGANKVVTNGNLYHNGYGTITSADVSQNTYVKSSGSISGARMKGSAFLTSSGTINSILAEKNYTVNGWQSTSGQIGGTLTKTQMWNSGVNISVIPNLVVSVETHTPIQISPLPEVEIPVNQTVDVYALKSSANYVFEYINNTIVITVNAVSGIPSGSYVLGNKVDSSGTHPQWLCKISDMVGTTCSQPVANICQGYSDYNGCFSYNTSSQTWSVSGTSMARGIVWFEGNLSTGNGTYINTWLATGNITTAGGHKSTAPNYAGYTTTCTNASYNGLTVNTNFANLIPTNLCDTVNSKMVENSIANSVYISGGYNPTTGLYGGGVVTLGSSTLAEGSVVGADVVNTGGSTTIKGSILANGQNVQNTSPMIFSGSTTIDLSGGSENYSPITIPCMRDCSTSSSSEETTIQNISAIQWIRYL